MDLLRLLGGTTEIIPTIVEHPAHLEHPLEIGEPDFDTPAHIVEAAVRALHEGHTHYTPAAGIPALRQTIARHISESRGIDARPEHVVVTPGAKPNNLRQPTLLNQTATGEPTDTPEPTSTPMATTIPTNTPVPLPTNTPTPEVEITTQTFPVYYCTHLGNNVFEWYEVEVTYHDGAPVSETVVDGPFTRQWQPGCPAGEPTSEPSGGGGSSDDGNSSTGGDSGSGGGNDGGSGGTNDPGPGGGWGDGEGDGGDG